MFRPCVPCCALAGILSTTTALVRRSESIVVILTTRSNFRSYAMIVLRSLLFFAALIGAMPALAHITLENREAAVGTFYKAVFRVGHGCGVSPTVKLRVRIPDGVITVRPMPKPGWQVETTTAP